MEIQPTGTVQAQMVSQFHVVHITITIIITEQQDNVVAASILVFQEASMTQQTMGTTLTGTVLDQTALPSLVLHTTITTTELLVSVDLQ